MARHPTIPLCRSELLQDLSIELGRRFAKDHPFRSFTADVDTCEHEGETFERLSVWASTPYGTLVNLTLWDDGTIWVSVRLEPAENNDEYKVGFYLQWTAFTAERVAEAFRDTVSVSTRLCYGESPLPTLRLIWKHDGEVETVGTLGRHRKNCP